MTKPATQAERIIRIETLLDTKLDAIIARLDKIEAHQNKQDDDARIDREDLAALKNKGAGLLVGAALAGGGIASGVGHILGWFGK